MNLGEHLKTGHMAASDYFSHTRRWTGFRRIVDGGSRL